MNDTQHISLNDLYTIYFYFYLNENTHTLFAQRHTKWGKCTRDTGQEYQKAHQFQFLLYTAKMDSLKGKLNIQDIPVASASGNNLQSNSLPTNAKSTNEPSSFSFCCKSSF